MIFVTVGTHEQPFNRLIQKVDELKRDGVIKDDVIIQTGFSTYKPKYCQWSKLISYQQMRLNPNAPQQYDRASWLTLMQHYGLPTRLLDWSESPLVALYFALSGDEDAKTDAAVWVLNPMKLNKKVGYGEYVPPISYDSLRGDLEGAFSDHDKDDYELQNRIIACHGVGCDLRMYVQQSDFTIHSTTERLDQILKLDESCDYFYKICIPQKIRKKLLVQLDAMGFHESSIYPDMEHIAKEQATSHFNF